MTIALATGLLVAVAFFVWSSPRAVALSSTGPAGSISAPTDDAALLASHGSSPGLPAATLVELTATQLDAGLPLAEAVSVLAHSTAGTGHPELQRVAAFTATSGAASATVLRGQAEQVRRAQFRRAERAAEALSVRLVLPLGLCCLPAFMCWGVLPVLMSLLPKVFAS